MAIPNFSPVSQMSKVILPANTTNKINTKKTIIITKNKLDLLPDFFLVLTGLIIGSVSSSIILYIMIILKLTENEANMIYDALRNHIDYVACDNDIEQENTLNSLFDKLNTVESE